MQIGEKKIKKVGFYTLKKHLFFFFHEMILDAQKHKKHISEQKEKKAAFLCA